MYFANVQGESDQVNGKLWFPGRTQEEVEAKAKKALPGKAFTLTRDEERLRYLPLVWSLAIRHLGLAK